MNYSQLIKFEADRTNFNFKHFEFNLNSKTIEYLGKNMHTIFNHKRLLSHEKAYSFKIKIIKSFAKAVHLGFCSKYIK